MSTRRPAPAQTEPARSHQEPRATSHAVYVGTSNDDQANIPDLDLALEVEGTNEAHERALLVDAQRLLAHEPTIQMSARCGATFCRLRIDRSGPGPDWARIDQTLRPIMVGEMIFQTQDDGATSLAYVYVSDEDTHLPLSVPEQQRERAQGI